MQIKLLSGGAGVRKGFCAGGGASLVPENMSWVPVMTDTLRNWKKCCMSRDGHYQVACVKGGGVFYSHDYGQTWTQEALGIVGDWTACVCSDDGQYFYVSALNGAVGIYRSNDYGVTWVQVYTDASNGLMGVACSADGKYLITGHSSGAIQVQVSSDYGATWANSFAIGAVNVKSCVSATGQYMYIANHTGTVYKNNNYGAAGSWDAGTVVDAGASQIDQLKCSGDLAVIIVIWGGRQMRISYDAGATWAGNSFVMPAGGLSDPGSDVYISSNGRYIALVASLTTNYYPAFHYSGDFGVSWYCTGVFVVGWTLSFSDDLRYVLRPSLQSGVSATSGVLWMRFS